MTDRPTPPLCGAPSRWLLPVLALTLAIPAPAYAQAYSSDPMVIRFGYTTFESPVELRRTPSPTLEAIAGYLQHLSALSRTDPRFLRPVDFEICLGNYYQILEWLQEGQIEAAVVSTFVAAILEHDRRAVPLVAFSTRPESLDRILDDLPQGVREGVDQWKWQGQWPLVASSHSGAGGGEPLEDYDRCLTAILDDARSIVEGREGERRSSRYTLHLVSHLSASGFVLPVLHADAWLGRRLEDVPGRQGRSVLEDSFWEVYFDIVRFQFDHPAGGGGGAPASMESREEGAISLHFSYSGRPMAKLAQAQRELGLGRWQAYSVGYDRDRRLGIPPIPNDLLVFRKEAADLLFAGEVAAMRDTPDPLWVSSETGPPAVFPAESVYTSALPVDVGRQASFRRVVREAFRPGEGWLGERFIQWFEQGKFEFTIDATFRFLRQDQESSGDEHLALVLPGGGVKSAYQAKILDLLYTDGYLRNPGGGSTPPAPREDAPLDPIPRGGMARAPADRQLTVREVVGTSGGAMVGLFTALKEERGGHPRLADLWWKDGEAMTSGADVFAAVDVMRWLSFYVAILIFIIVSYIALEGRYRSAPASGAPGAGERTPWRVAIVLVLIVILGPLLVSWVGGGERAMHVSWTAGVPYAATVLLVHLAMNCCVGGPRPAGGPFSLRAAALRSSTLLALAAIALVIPAVLLGRHGEPAYGHPAWASAGTAGLLLSVGSIVALAREGRSGLLLKGVRLYLKSLILIVIVVAGSSLIVFIASCFGLATFLELTPQFWIALAVGALAVSLGCMAVRAWAPDRGIGRHVREGLDAFMGRHLVGHRTTRPYRTLALILAAGILLWTFLTSRGIYGSANALASFGGRVREILVAKGAATGPVPLQSNLIVTAAAAIEPFKFREEGRPPAEGEVYFCFYRSSESGEPALEGDRWVRIPDPQGEDLLDPVFASGSPFPIFPPHRVSVRGNEGALIDGGYAHNIPVEAAALAGARQALIIRSQPVSERSVARATGKGSRGPVQGQFARRLGQILPFMFQRAQEVDRKVTEDLVVASISAHDRDSPVPFLADFRPATVRRMVETAEEDFVRGRRIGFVESWGLPVVYTRVGPGGTKEMARHLRLAEAGWRPDVRGTLMKRLTTETGQRVAVFDFDNTCIRNDIGEAIFLKQIVERRYRGERAEFWQQFDDREAARALHAYWREYREWARDARPLDAWEVWDESFRDYVCLFYHQYLRRLERPDGPDAAYRWLASLQIGMTEEEVAALARETWEEETRRPLRRITLTSMTYGDVGLNLGIRVYPQIRDLVRSLRGGLGWDVWVVTASSQPAVAAVADQVGIDPDRVIGMRAEEGKDGGFTGEVIEPVTCGTGKAETLRARGLIPSLVVGDSLTDLEMLRMSEAIALVIDRGAIPADRLTGGPRGPTWLRQGPEEFLPR